MKNILKFGFISFLAIIAFSACEVDPDGTTNPPNPADPTISTVSEIGFVDFSATVEPGAVFSVKIIADKGDNDLKALTIKENGINVDLSRITIDGVAAPANPILLVGNTTSFEAEIDIVAHTGEFTSTYSFEVLDEANAVSSTSVDITTLEDMTMVTPPNILIDGSRARMAAPGTVISIPLSVVDVTSPLTTIAVLEDGILIDTLRLWYDDFSIQFPSNPASIPPVDENELMRDILIKVHQTAGIKTYTIEIGDASMATYSTEFTVETGSSVTTLDGVLFNRAGPAGTGGLDLDTGNGTGSSDAEAEIKDEGIDGGPLASNWIRRISGVNGSVIKHLFKGQNGLPDTYDFANIATAEQISALWDNGISFVDTNGSGDLVSLRVEVGDEFIVQRDSKNYLIKVTQINETTDNNGDNYVMDIKF